MSDENRKKLQKNELEHHGDLDFLEDTISEIESIAKTYTIGLTDRARWKLEDELVQLVINAR